MSFADLKMSESGFDIMPQAQVDKYVADLFALLPLEGMEATSEHDFRRFLKRRPLPIKTGLSVNASVYRAVLPREGMELSQIQSFSHPMSAQCKSRGRCHVPGKPVFYGAGDLDTAVKECLQTTGGEKDGSFVYVSKWRSCVPLNYVEFLYPAGFLQSELTQSINERSQNQMRESFRMYDAATTQRFELLAQTIGKSFLAEDHSRTSRLSHSILYGQGRDLKERRAVHAIVYPSVVKKHGAINLAVAPFVVRDYFVPEAVWKFQVLGNVKDGVHLKYLGYGMVRKGKQVNWFDIGPSRQFTSVVGAAVVSRGGMPVEVDGDTCITIDGQEIRIADYIMTKHWATIAQSIMNLGTTTEDVMPGVSLKRQYPIQMIPAVKVASVWGEVIADSILVQLSIDFEFLPRTED